MTESSRAHVLGAAFLVTISTYLSYALGLAAGALVARSLGPEAYGRYAYLVWMSGLLVVFANHGLTTSAIRFVAESLGKGSLQLAQQIHGFLSRLQWICLGSVVIAFVCLSFLFPQASWSVGNPALIAATVLCVISRAAYLFDISVAKGHSKFQVEAYSTMAIGLLSAIATVVLWLNRAGLNAFVLLYTVASVTMFIMAQVQCRIGDIRRSTNRLTADKRREIKTHLLWTTLLVSAGAMSKRSIETFFLNAYWGSVPLGFFTLASGLARGSTELLTVGLTTVLMPSMGRAFGAGGAPRVQAIFSRAFRYFVFFGILLAGASAFVSNPIVLLFYGAEYEEVATALQILQIAAGLTLSEAAFGALLATTGNQSIWARISLVPVALSAIGAATLVPHYGLMGALMSASIARVLGFGVLVSVTLCTQKLALPVLAAGRLAIGGALAATVGYIVMATLPGIRGHIFAGLTFALAFLAFSILLRAWDESDAQMLDSFAERFPGLRGLLHHAARIIRSH